MNYSDKAIDCVCLNALDRNIKNVVDFNFLVDELNKIQLVNKLYEV